MDDKDFGMTDEEMIAYKWQFERFGSFFMSLMKAIVLADDDNLSKLALAYPAHVQAYRLYSEQAGWWKEVLKKARLAGLIKEGQD